MNYELHSIDTLCLAGAIKCTVHRDLSPLIKVGDVGEVGEEILLQHWAKINSAFFEIIDDKEVKNYINETSHMQELVFKIQSVRYVVETLRAWPCENGITKWLREEFDVALDLSEPEQYNEDLERVLVELVQYEIELQHLQAIQEAKEEKQGPSMVTEDSFDAILIEVYAQLFKLPVMNLENVKNEMTYKSYALYLKRLMVSSKQPKAAVA